MVHENCEIRKFSMEIIPNAVFATAKLDITFYMYMCLYFISKYFGPTDRHFKAQRKLGLRLKSYGLLGHKNLSLLWFTFLPFKPIQKVIEPHIA